MRDYPALPPCPRRKRGAHRIVSMVAFHEEHGVYFTMNCRRCGVVRLGDAGAFVPMLPLDDMGAEAILRAALG